MRRSKRMWDKLLASRAQQETESGFVVTSGLVAYEGKVERYRGADAKERHVRSEAYPRCDSEVVRVDINAFFDRTKIDECHAHDHVVVGDRKLVLQRV